MPSTNPPTPARPRRTKMATSWSDAAGPGPGPPVPGRAAPPGAAVGGRPSPAGPRPRPRRFTVVSRRRRPAPGLRSAWGRAQRLRAHGGAQHVVLIGEARGHHDDPDRDPRRLAALLTCSTKRDRVGALRRGCGARGSPAAASCEAAHRGPPARSRPTPPAPAGVRGCRGAAAGRSVRVTADEADDPPEGCRAGAAAWSGLGRPHVGASRSSSGASPGAGRGAARSPAPVRTSSARAEARRAPEVQGWRGGADWKGGGRPGTQKISRGSRGRSGDRWCASICSGAMYCRVPTLWCSSGAPRSPGDPEVHHLHRPVPGP